MAKKTKQIADTETPQNTANQSSLRPALQNNTPSTATLNGKPFSITSPNVTGNNLKNAEMGQLQDAQARQKELDMNNQVQANIDALILKNRTAARLNELIGSGQTPNAPQNQLQTSPTANKNETLLNTPIDQQMKKPVVLSPNTEGIDKTLQSGQTGNVLSLSGQPDTFPNTLHTAAKVYEGLESSIFGVRKTGSVTSAEQGFLDASNIITKDIELVKIGQKNPLDVQKDIQRSIDSINSLEEETHGLGLISLRYWLSNGRELQTSISQEKSNLEQQRILLLQAVDQYNQAKRTNNFGL